MPSEAEEEAALNFLFADRITLKTTGIQLFYLKNITIKLL